MSKMALTHAADVDSHGGHEQASHQGPNTHSAVHCNALGVYLGLLNYS